MNRNDVKYKNENKTLLILDIDETLIHARESKLEREADFMIFDYFVYKRPYLEAFINSIKDDFLLAIWSSASDDYVEEITQKIIPDSISLEFVWGKSRCTFERNFQTDEYGYLDNDFYNHYHYTKRLKKLKRKGYKMDRILIVDDSPHKSKENYGNAIYPKEYLGDLADNELKLLTQYLQQLKNLRNVRRIEKRYWQNKFQ